MAEQQINFYIGVIKRFKGQFTFEEIRVQVGKQIIVDTQGANEIQFSTYLSRDGETRLNTDRNVLRVNGVVINPYTQSFKSDEGIHQTFTLSIEA